MFRFHKNSFRNSRHVFYWYGLAFQAGAINAGGFLACHSFVSHVTGIGTQIGIQLAAGAFMTVVELLTIPTSYLAGAILSASLIDQRQADGKAPSYIAVTGIMFALLAGVLFLGGMGWLGEFGEPFELGRDVALVSALCMVCGMQNAAVVTATQGTIRTTHLTGTLTDIGLFLVRNRNFKRISKEKYRQISLNRIRVGIFLAFSTGSALSAEIFLQYKYLGFVMPCLTSFVFLCLSYSSGMRIPLFGGKIQPLPTREISKGQ